jgi:hypothetical protein
VHTSLALTSLVTAEMMWRGARIHQLLIEAADTPLPGDAGLTAERAEELISEIRAARDAR